MRKSLTICALWACFLLFISIGIARAEDGKKVIIWDFDGVIVDSARETYAVTLESLKRHQSEIGNTFGSTMKEYSHNAFYADRPFVKKAHEYFLHAVSRSWLNKAADQLSEQNRSELYDRHKPLFDKLTSTFYAVRKEFQEKDINSWYELNPIYQGIPDAMQKLKDMGCEFVVMSSKDKASIWSLFKHHGLAGYFNEGLIFDQSAGKDRQAQMMSVLNKIGSENEFTIIDDLPEQLAISRKVLEGKKAQYIAAKWGYGSGLEKYPFVRIVENPEDLPAAIGKSKH